MQRRLLRSGRQAANLLWPFLALLLVWELVALANIWPDAFLPPPLAIPETFVNMLAAGDLLPHVLPSVRRVAVASAIGLSLGLVLGIAVGVNRQVSYALTDLNKFLQAVGEVGWLPMLVLWFGFNDKTIVITIAYTVFFPVFFGTIGGIAAVPKNLQNLVATLGGNRRQLIFEVLIPGALPSVISGFRTGMGFGWRTVILAEMLVGSAGLGVMIFTARETFRIDRIFVGMALIGILWLITDSLLLRPLEARTIERWGVVK